MWLLFNCLVALVMVCAVSNLTRGDDNEQGYHTVGSNTIASNTGFSRRGKHISAKLILSYISKPTSALVKIVCMANSFRLFEMSILCPAIDKADGNVIVPNRAKSDSGYTKRVISWTAIGNHTEFHCFCQGWQTSGVMVNDSIKVEVFEIPNHRPPLIHIRRKTEKKQKVHLKCHVTGGPHLHVIWYKSNKRISFGQNGTTWMDGVRYHRNTHRLKFSRARKEASGVYRCYVRTLAGSAWGLRYQVFLYDVNSCLSNPCNSNATCTNMFPRFSCSCKPGFTGNGNVCTDIDECLLNNCQNDTACKNTIGSFSCLTTHGPPNKKRRGSNWFVALIILPIAVVIGLFVRFKKKRKGVMLDNNTSDLNTSSVFEETSHEVTSLIPETESQSTNSPRAGNSESARALEASFSFLPNMRYSNSLPLLHQRHSPVNFPIIDVHARPCKRNRSFHSSKSCSTDLISDLTRHSTVQSDERYFVTAPIGYSGGQLILNKTGIKLIIPPGALPLGTTADVSVSLVEDDKDLPHLGEQSSLISPIIRCGPPGLKFEKPVMLIYPHYAAVKKGISGLKILCSEPSENEDTKWETIFDADETPTDDCFCLIDENVCVLSVSHFTKFASVCRCKGKMINLLAFSTKSILPKEYCKIRVYCFPNSEICRERIQEEEREMDGTRCDPVRSLMFVEGGGGLLVRIKDIDESWKNVYEASQDVDYKEVWYCSTVPVSRTFILSRKNPEADMFTCRIDVIQQEVEDAKTSTINVAFQATLTKQNPLPSSSSCSSSSGYVTTGYGQEAKESCIPSELRTKLANCLDPERILDGRDWRMLGEGLKVGGAYIKWLTRNKRIESPTEYILRYYENFPSQESTREKLQSLARILRDMERGDASEYITEYLKKKPGFY